MSMGTRRKRVLTPELRRRRRMNAKLQDLGISLKSLGDRSGMDVSIFSRFLWNDIEDSEAEKVILEAIREREEEIKSLKPGEFIYL